MDKPIPAELDWRPAVRMIILVRLDEFRLRLNSNPSSKFLFRRILDAERVAPLVCSFVYLCRKLGGRKVNSLFAKLMPHQCGSVGVGGVN